MNNIKKFEYFNYSFYKEILSDEFNELHDKYDWHIKNSDIGRKEIDLIKSSVEESPRNIFNNDSIYLKIGFTPNGYKLNCTIRKFDDEWFSVMILRVENGHTLPPKFYKCDQFDGLVKLLQDENIMKK